MAKKITTRARSRSRRKMRVMESLISELNGGCSFADPIRLYATTGVWVPTRLRRFRRLDTAWMTRALPPESRN